VQARRPLVAGRLRRGGLAKRSRFDAGSAGERLDQAVAPPPSDDERPTSLH